MNKISRVTGIIESVNRIFYIFAAICLSALFVLMTSDVAGRFLFNSPIKGASEVGVYFIVVVAFLGLGYTQSIGKHVRIDILIMRLPEKARNILDIILLLLSAAFFVMVTWEVGLVAHNDFVRKISAPQTLLQLPMWVISFIASVGCALLVITLLVQVVQKLYRVERMVIDY